MSSLVKACLPGKQSGEELFLSQISLSVLTKRNKYAFCDEECYDPALVLVPLRCSSLNLGNT